MGRTRVKICGLTRPSDAVAACEAGADAIGLVFYPPSSRNLSPECAREISSAVPPFVQRVGLFVDADPELVREMIVEADLDLLQFHGNESAGYCESFGRGYIKSLAMKPGVDPATVFSQHPAARGFLLDTYHPARPGGTGETFNWDLFPHTSGRPLILAGGLTADNVTEAIRACTPYAVDVSGGVESTPGIKSAEKISAFIRQVRMSGDLL